MKSYPRMSRYPVNTQVENKNGYVRVKVADNKWQGLGAYLLTRNGIKIEEGDRVFFADGDRTNRSVSNLRRIHFNTTKFILLARSRVIYMPSKLVVAPDVIRNKSFKFAGTKEVAA